MWWVFAIQNNSRT